MSRQEPPEFGAAWEQGGGRTPRATSSAPTVTSNTPLDSRESSKAQAKTSTVRGSTATVSPAAERLIRAKSLSGRWKLIRRSMAAISSNAASMARCASASGKPSTRMITSVPRSGRARLMGWKNIIDRQELADAALDGLGRQRYAGQVFDVLARHRFFTAKLGEPSTVGNVVMGDAFQHFDPDHGSRGVERHGVSEVGVLHDHHVEEVPAPRGGTPNHHLAAVQGGAEGLPDLLILIVAQRGEGFGQSGSGKQALLRFLHADEALRHDGLAGDQGGGKKIEADSH